MTCDTWDVTQDTWHATIDTWYVTRDTQQVTCDMFYVVGGEHSLKMSAPYLLWFVIYDISQI